MNASADLVRPCRVPDCCPHVSSETYPTRGTSDFRSNPSDRAPIGCRACCVREVSDG